MFKIHFFLFMFKSIFFLKTPLPLFYWTSDLFPISQLVVEALHILKKIALYI